MLSLDALRGFAMFWLIGGREWVLAVVACLAPSLYDATETQLTHPRWQGFVAWDMIMPVFLFVVGTAIPFAMAKHRQRGESHRAIYARMARRVAWLWILGMAAQGCLLKFQIQGMELYSNTLQAIAVGYVVASLAWMHLRLAGQLALCVALVVGYAVLLCLVPFGGHAAGTLEKFANFPLYVDQLLLGNFRRDHSYTWIVTSLGFSATVLLGAFAGRILQADQPVRRRLIALIAAGVTCAAAGWIWSYWLPLNRHLWTSSMILWSGGLSFLLVAAFYWVIDVAGYKRWSLPLVILGANALVAYVLDEVFGRVISDTLVLNLAHQFSQPYNELIRATGEVGLMWLLVWYLYQKRTFVRA